MKDHEVVKALETEDPSACQMLYDAYGAALYQYCWLSLRDTEMARIALRDTFVVAQAHISRLTDAGRLRAWLYAIADAECERARPTLEKFRPPGAGRGHVPGGAQAGPLVVAQPQTLRVRVVSCATAPELAAYRAHVARRANRFDNEGFPVRPKPPRSAGHSLYVLPGVIAVASAVFVALLITLHVTGLGDTTVWAIDPATMIKHR